MHFAEQYENIGIDQIHGFVYMTQTLKHEHVNVHVDFMNSIEQTGS